jgi:hypothetical protein
LPSGIAFIENLSLGVRSEWKVTKFADSVGLTFPIEGEADVIASIGDIKFRVGYAILEHEETDKGNLYADVAKFMTREEAIAKCPELASVELPEDAQTDPVEFRVMRVKPMVKKAKAQLPVAEELEQAVL